jgi:Do/DeqQ family serine protease
VKENYTKNFIKKTSLLVFTFSCVLHLSSVPLHAQTGNPRITPVVSAVQKVSPAVVNISTEAMVSSNPFMSFDPFTDDFFRDFFDARPVQRSRKSLGSGIIIKPDGYVITNAHVITRATNITVALADNRTYSARVIGADPDFDVAVLKIQTAETLPYISLGTSSDLMPGETVIAIGNPFGLSHTVTTGVISSVNRSIRTEKRIYEDFIQTDAAINPGNSGGPLVNINGELIGVNTAIYQEGEGIGFAIPVDKIHLIAEDLLAYGTVQPAYMGIRVQDLTPSLKQSLGYSDNTGAVIFKIDEKSPGDEKLLPGDILVELNGKVVSGRRAFGAYSNGLVAGEKVQLKIYRDGAFKKVPLVTTDYPFSRAPALCWELLGIHIDDDRGNGIVVTRVDPKGGAGYVGIRTGDVLYQLGDREVETVKQFYETLIRYRNASSIFMVVGRNRYAYRVTIPTG